MRVHVRVRVCACACVRECECACACACACVGGRCAGEVPEACISSIIAPEHGAQQECSKTFSSDVGARDGDTGGASRSSRLANFPQDMTGPSFNGSVSMPSCLFWTELCETAADNDADAVDAAAAVTLWAVLLEYRAKPIAARARKADAAAKP